MPPLFCFHGEPVRLAQQLSSEQPVYALNYVYGATHGRATPESVQELAELYTKEIKVIDPDGPYYLLGFSAGATIAYEVARQLVADDCEIGHLFLVEPTTAAPSDREAIALIAQSMRRGHFSKKDSAVMARRIWRVAKRQPTAISRRIVTMWHETTGRPMPTTLRWKNFIVSLLPVVRKYDHRPLDCPADVFLRVIEPEYDSYIGHFWESLLSPAVTIHYLPGLTKHLDLMTASSLSAIAGAIEARTSE